MAPDSARNGTTMANTKSAKKATRKIARRTEVNKARRSRMRSYLRKVEDAIASGDKAQGPSALEGGRAGDHARRAEGRHAQEDGEPKVSRLTHQIAKLGQ